MLGGKTCPLISDLSVEFCSSESFAISQKKIWVVKAIHKFSDAWKHEKSFNRVIPIGELLRQGAAKVKSAPENKVRQFKIRENSRSSLIG